MLLAAALLVWYLLARQHPTFDVDRGRQPVRAAAVGLCCSVLASYASVSRSAMSGSQVNAADRGLILLAGWLGILLVAADGIDDEDRLHALLRRVVLGASFMAIIGIAEFATGTDFTQYATIPGLSFHQQVTDLMTRVGLVRSNSTAAQPLEFSAVLTICLPLAIHQARHARSRWDRRLAWSQVALIGATIPMTVSRSAVLALVVAAAVLIPSWPSHERRRAYLALLAVPLAVWLIAPSLAASFASTFSQLGTDTSTTSRTGALSFAAPLIARHPWFGQGLATFNPQTAFFIDDQFITSLIETGIAGLLAIVAVFAAGWYVTRKTRVAATNPATRDLARCLAASLAAFVVFFATFDVLSFSIDSGLFFLLTGCAAAAWRLSGSRQEGARLPLPGSWHGSSAYAGASPAVGTAPGRLARGRQRDGPQGPAAPRAVYEHRNPEGG